MRKLVVQICAVLVSLSFAFAEVEIGAKEPEELVQLKKAYAEAQAKALDPIIEKYHSSLALLQENLAKAGDLNGALIVRAEKNGSNASKESDQPKELLKLKTAYESAHAKESATLTVKYLAALEKIQKKMTQKGDLKGGLMVKAEREKHTQNKKKKEVDAPKAEERKLPRNRKDFEEYLVGTSWCFKKNETDEHAFTFLADGKYVSLKRSLKYEVTGLREVTILWGSKTRVKCEISRDFQTMKELNGERNELRRVVK